MPFLAWALLGSLAAARGARAAAKKQVLITGFEPFDGESSNPSGDVAKALNGTCAGSVCYESLVLSVDTDGAQVVADLLNGGSRWDAILQLGEDVSGGAEVSRGVCCPSTRVGDDALSNAGP